MPARSAGCSGRQSNARQKHSGRQSNESKHRKDEGSASRDQAPATMSRAAIACAVLALLAGRVHGNSCNLGYVPVADSLPCKGTFYLSTAKDGGSADIWLSADSTRGLQQDLVSRNDAFQAKLQDNGNFVVYRKSDSHPLWAAGMAGAGSNPWRLAIETDGNIVIYSEVSGSLGNASCSGQGDLCRRTWDSGTWTQGIANGPFRLVMQNDGNLVLYNNADNAPWSAGTAQAGYADDPADKSLSKGTCDSCAACAAGKYRDAAQAACTACWPGKYSANSGMSLECLLFGRGIGGRHLGALAGSSRICKNTMFFWSGKRISTNNPFPQWKSFSANTQKGYQLLQTHLVLLCVCVCVCVCKGEREREFLFILQPL